MPCTRRKKTRKLRGKVTHGHGRVGKHRKHPGGRGNAGGLTHMRVWFDRFHPGYFGKVGMRHFHAHKQAPFNRPINVSAIWSLVGEEAYKAAKEAKDGKATVIDVVEHGYTKVLGTGQIPNIPVIVRAKFFSKRAEAKIRAAGGVCELRA